MKLLTKTGLVLGLAMLSTLSAGDIQSADGAYGGVGVGYSAFNASYRDSSYHFPEDGEDTGSSEQNSIDANDIGYRIYGGYQFNKIIGVEMSYNDYGHMDDGLFSQDPYSLSVSANAGYNFVDNQIRPFGILGLGYMKANQNTEVFDESVAAVHFGAGFEYYPSIFHGVGFRTGLEGDYKVKREYAYSEADSGDLYSLETLRRTYVMYYLAVAYKF